MSYLVNEIMADYTDRSTGNRQIRAYIVADTAADLPANTTALTWLLGSYAKTVDTGDEYYIDSSGSWILQPSSVFTSNYYTKAETDGRLSAHVCQCDTAGNVADKVATTSDDFILREGAIVCVKYTYTNSTTDSASTPITLNVNNTGAYRIYYDTGAYNGSYSPLVFGQAGLYIYYVFHNNRWVWINCGKETTYIGMTQAQATAGTSTSSMLISPKVLNDAILNITDHKAAVSFTPTPIVSLLNCTFTIPDSSRTLRFTVGKLNATQNYLQIYVNGVDKGYIIFDVSRNIDDWGE